MALHFCFSSGEWSFISLQVPHPTDLMANAGRGRPNLSIHWHKMQWVSVQGTQWESGRDMSLCGIELMKVAMYRRGWLTHLNVFVSSLCLSDHHIWPEIRLHILAQSFSTSPWTVAFEVTAEHWILTKITVCFCEPCWLTQCHWAASSL